MQKKIEGLQKQLEEDRHFSQSRDSSLFKDMLALNDKHYENLTSFISEDERIKSRLNSNIDNLTQDLERLRNHTNNNSSDLKMINDKVEEYRKELLDFIHLLSSNIDLLKEKTINLSKKSDLITSDQHIGKISHQSSLNQLESEIKSYIGIIAKDMRKENKYTELANIISNLNATIQEFSHRTAKNESRLLLIEHKLGEIIYKKKVA